MLFENPGYLGTLEQNAAEIASLARAAGAETIVGVDPISLGIVAPPSEYGADIVVGSVQPLGVHMSGGGGAGGFIATRDEERYAREYPTLNLSIGRTVEGEYGFGIALFEQTSYGLREDGNDWTGNSVYLHAVANAAYMALMGPEGFAEVGRLIVGRSHYAARRLARARRRARSSSPTGSSRSSSSPSTRRARRSPMSIGGCSRGGSSAARTSRATSRSSDRAPSTASPKCTPGRTSIDSSKR